RMRQVAEGGEEHVELLLRTEAPRVEDHRLLWCDAEPPSESGIAPRGGEHRRVDAARQAPRPLDTEASDPIAHASVEQNRQGAVAEDESLVELDDPFDRRRDHRAGGARPASRARGEVR